jgi:hypothetical protein
MVKDGDIFGDGVNIAVRLEGLAEPGGICISRGVHDHVRRKLPYGFEDLGEQSVKNIAQPIRVFRLIPDVTKQSAPGREAALMPSAVLDDLPSLSELPRAPMATRPPSLDGYPAAPNHALCRRRVRARRRARAKREDRGSISETSGMSHALGRGALSAGLPGSDPAAGVFWRALVERPTRTENVVVLICVQYSTTPDVRPKEGAPG